MWGFMQHHHMHEAERGGGAGGVVPYQVGTLSRGVWGRAWVGRGGVGLDSCVWGGGVQGWGEAGRWAAVWGGGVQGAFPPRRWWCQHASVHVEEAVCNYPPPRRPPPPLVMVPAWTLRRR